MIPDAMLIQMPAVDFDAFLGIARQALGYNPAAAIDASPLKHADAERFLTCLAAMKDPNASVGMPPQFLAHVTLGILAAADARDMLAILEVATGMPFVVADTLVGGVKLAVISGTLAAWRDAVKFGAARESEPNVRTFFNRVMELFVAAGLGGIWKDYESRPLPDQTFYLEDRRKR